MIGSLLGILAEDAQIIPYRPKLREAAGSVTAAILLQQIIYRWYHNGQKPFYKYKEPCNADSYRAGDSWCEELGFSRSEFDTALAKIATKIKAGHPRPDSFVWYWVTMDRKTWYNINQEAIEKLLVSTYSGNPALRKEEIPRYVNQESRVIYSDNPAIDIYTKNTTENTAKNTTEINPPSTIVHRSFSEDPAFGGGGLAHELAIELINDCLPNWNNPQTYVAALTEDQAHNLCQWLWIVDLLNWSNNKANP